MKINHNNHKIEFGIDSNIKNNIKNFQDNSNNILYKEPKQLKNTFQKNNNLLKNNLSISDKKNVEGETQMAKSSALRALLDEMKSKNSNSLIEINENFSGLTSKNFSHRADDLNNNNNYNLQVNNNNNNLNNIDLPKYSLTGNNIEKELSLANIQKESYFVFNNNTKINNNIESNIQNRGLSVNSSTSNISNMDLNFEDMKNEIDNLQFKIDGLEKKLCN